MAISPLLAVLLQCKQSQWNGTLHWEETPYTCRIQHHERSQSRGTEMDLYHHVSKVPISVDIWCHNDAPKDGTLAAHNPVWCTMHHSLDIQEGVLEQ